VDDPSCEGPDRLHPLGGPDLFFRGDKLGDVPLHAEEADDLSIGVADRRDGGLFLEKLPGFLPVDHAAAPRLAPGQLVPHLPVERLVVPFALEEPRVPADGFLPGVPREAFEGGIDVLDRPVHVGDHDHLVGLPDRHLEEGARLFRLFPVGDAHQDDCRMGEDLYDTDDHHGSCDDGDGSRPPAHTRLFPLTRRRPFSFPPNVLFYCR